MDQKNIFSKNRQFFLDDPIILSHHEDSSDFNENFSRVPVHDNESSFDGIESRRTQSDVQMRLQNNRQTAQDVFQFQTNSMLVPVDAFQPANKMQDVRQFGQKSHFEQPNLFRGNSGDVDPSAYQWQARRTSVTQQLFTQQYQPQTPEKETTGIPVTTFSNFSPFGGNQQAKKLEKTGTNDPMQMQDVVEEVLSDYQQFKMSLSEKAQFETYSVFADMEMSQADSEVEDLLMHTFTNTDDENDSLLE